MSSFDCEFKIFSNNRVTKETCNPVSYGVFYNCLKEAVIENGNNIKNIQLVLQDRMGCDSIFDDPTNTFVGSLKDFLKYKNLTLQVILEE